MCASALVMRAAWLLIGEELCHLITEGSEEQTKKERERERGEKKERKESRISELEGRMLSGAGEKLFPDLEMAHTWRASFETSRDVKNSKGPNQEF